MLHAALAIFSCKGFERLAFLPQERHWPRWFRAVHESAAMGSDGILSATIFYIRSFVKTVS